MARDRLNGHLDNVKRIHARWLASVQAGRDRTRALGDLDTAKEEAQEALQRWFRALDDT